MELMYSTAPTKPSCCSLKSGPSRQLAVEPLLTHDRAVPSRELENNTADDSPIGRADSARTSALWPASSTESRNGETGAELIVWGTKPGGASEFSNLTFSIRNFIPHSSSILHSVLSA